VRGKISEKREKEREGTIYSEADMSEREIKKGMKYLKNK